MAIGIAVVGIDEMVEQHLKGLDALVPKEPDKGISDLRAHIFGSFRKNQDARESGGVNRLMLDALRAYNGQYDPEDLVKIAQEGGSTVFMNLTSTKVRAAISWIKDILLASKQDAFSIKPTPLVDLPEGTEERIREVVTKDFERMLQPPPVQEGQQQGPPPDIQETLKEINERKRDLYQAIRDEVNKEAEFSFKIIETKIKDQMKEGKWEKALSEFIDDFCIFPTAYLKGPIVSMRKKLKWANGAVSVVEGYQMMNKRVSPLDIYPSPEAASVYDGDFIEHLRLSRKELASLKDMTEASGYKPEAIKKVLENKDGLGLASSFDTNIEDEKAREELRTDTHRANENVYHGLHFFGSAPCKLLKDWGLANYDFSGHDPDDELDIEAILVGTEVIKCVINDDPLGRRPYYSASYQKRPGSIWGAAPPFLMRDIQKMCNACARALSNNMGLSSGPIGEVNIDRLADGQLISELKPRDIIQVTADPTGAAGRAVSFFTIPSVAQELLAVYEAFETRADDVTMIPRYAYGNANTGGAANTASGLSMMLESASKGIKDAIRHIDEGVIIPRVEMEFYTTLLKGDIDFTGDINVIALGSETLTLAGAAQMRRNEFIQVTANPMDQEIMGLGRAEILRKMADDLGFGENIVPNRQELKASRKKKEEAQQAPPPQVQAAQVQNDTIYQIAQERNQLVAADLDRKTEKDQADVQLKAMEVEQRQKSDSTKLIGKLEDTKLRNASEEHRADQKIALELQETI